MLTLSNLYKTALKINFEINSPLQFVPIWRLCRAHVFLWALNRDWLTFDSNGGRQTHFYSNFTPWPFYQYGTYMYSNSLSIPKNAPK